MRQFFVGLNNAKQMETDVSNSFCIIFLGQILFANHSLFHFQQLFIVSYPWLVPRQSVQFVMRHRALIVVICHCNMANLHLTNQHLLCVLVQMALLQNRVTVLT
jgi:hypothetical protein